MKNLVENFCSYILIAILLVICGIGSLVEAILKETKRSKNFNEILFVIALIILNIVAMFWIGNRMCPAYGVLLICGDVLILMLAMKLAEHKEKKEKIKPRQWAFD